MPLGRRRIGFDGPYTERVHRMSTRLLTDSVRFEESNHIVTNCMDLLDRVLPGTKQSDWTRLCVSPERTEYGNKRIRSLGFTPDRVTAIHPSSDGSMKSWPMPRPIELGRLLAAESARQVLFIMSPSEYAAIAQPLRELEQEHSNVRHLVTQSFAELAQVVANVRLCVANDGGPMHVAAALGVPTVALFGPTDERLYGAVSPTARVVRGEHGCGRKHRPWRVDCDCPGRACLANVTPAQVATAVRELLEATAVRAEA